jgi:hypothetical protein
MKRSLLNKWIIALESGKYPQGRDELKSDEGLCCMGVLCKVARLPSYKWYGYAALPASFANRMHMEMDGEVVRGRGPGLATLNDSLVSFSRIAARLRKNPHAYIRGIIEDGSPVLGVKK